MMTRFLHIPVLALTAASPLWAEDRALVIGIDAYPALPETAQLRTATKDAQDVARWLREDLGFAAGAVTVLLDGAATSSAILDTLIDRLVGETGPGDRVVLYFAGLGAQTRASDGSLARVILAHDSGGPLGRIPQEAIADILALIPDREVTVIVDAAFAGNGAPRARGVTLPGVTPERGTTFPFASAGVPRTIWTAAGPGQMIWETAEGGVFTQGFLDGLRGAADTNGNGTVSNAELLTHLRAISADWCRLNLDCAGSGLGLTPNFAGAVEASMGTASAPPAASGPVLTGAATDDTLGLVTDLFVPSNDANLTLTIDGGATLRLGQVIAFTVTADRPGTLVLLDINPLGALAQVFPSSLAPDSGTRVTPGAPVTIPQGLSASGRALQVRVTEPVGQGFLLGLLIEDDLPDMAAILPQNLAGGPVADAGAYLFDIAQDLLDLRPNGPGSAPVRWSATYLPYTITD